MSKTANSLFDVNAKGANDAAEGDTEQVRTDFPCSVAQERFWLLDRLDPGNASYNVAVRWRLEGRLSSDILERAWLTIIDRHEILRTVFLEVDGDPIQRIMPNSPFKMAEIDLSTLPPNQQQVEGDRIGVIEARAPFDLGTGPLIRVTLLRFSSVSCIILVTTHQIVSDGWSIGVMAREMGLIYDAIRHDKPDPLDPIAIQYADYSEWQLEWLRVRGTDAETVYWSKQLAGVKPFKVFADKPRPAMPTTNGVIVSRVLPRELTNRAQAICAARGATLFAAALGALCAMLARYTRQDEVVLGTQVSDRNQVELESMIGQFVNSLILRNDLSGDPRFVDIIDRVANTSTQALEFRHIPIERLLGMVKGEHGKANTPPISVNFIFQKTFIQNTTYTDFSLTDMPSLPAGAIYDLNFFMVERPDGWRFSLQYNTDQFEDETGLRFLAYFQSTLESAVADPQTRLAELRLAAPEESRQLLERRGHAPVTLEAQTILDLFQTHVIAAPKAIAAVCGNQHLSYQQLNAEADRIAAGLRSRGIGLGSRVALCADRSLMLLNLVLAVLKTGASCIPLDPADSPQYHWRAARDAQVSAVVVQAATGASWRNSGLLVIDIDEMLAERPSSKPLAAPPSVVPQAEAYVNMYAKGGDGVRGVGLSHLELATVLDSTARRIGMNKGDAMAAVTPIGLGEAILEFLLPLISGARLIIATSKDLESRRALAQFLKRSNTTVCHAAAETWDNLLHAGWSAPAGFKLISGRGIMTAAVVQQLAQQGAEIWTAFGAVRTGIWTTLQQAKPRQNSGVLGAPVGNWSLRVNDRKGRLTEVGTTGELAIVDCRNGTSIASGDLARIRADGEVEWLARSDSRFLHNGHLVDPSAIESLLLQRPDVIAARVAVGQAALAGILVACVAVRGEPTEALSAALGSVLGEALPAAIVPAVLAVRDALPLERDGSLNWRMLRSNDRGARGAIDDAPPPSDVEKELATIWSTLLGVKDIDPTANFFELGGHSLLAARMLTRVNTVFGRKVTLNALFRAPTIRELSQVLGQKESREFDFRQMVKLQPNGSRPPLIAINNTGTYYALAKSLGNDQPVISLQLFDPSVQMYAMPESLEEVAAEYVQLIRRVQPHGPYNLMGWCVAGALSFEIARLLGEAGEQITNLYLMDSWLPRYIARQPLFRRFISDYTLRWGLIIADWRAYRSGRQPLSAFLNNRNGVKTLRQLWNKFRNAPPEEAAPAADEISRRDYDLWLLHYLQSITSKYEPRPIAGKLTLFRSRKEPTGLLFDPLAGWGSYAKGGVELHMVDGDHFTMFQNPGAQQMAKLITDSMALAPAAAKI